MKGRSARIFTVAIAVAFVATACAWGQAGGNAARNRANPFEPGLTLDNVGNLQLAWQANGLRSEPVMTDKYLYSTTLDGYLNAYAAGGPASAEGASRCTGSPVVCTPVWFSRVSQYTPGAEIVVDGDQVFVSAFTDGQWSLVALDANPMSCPDTTSGCAPSWTGHLAGPSGLPTPYAMAVADGRVYVLHLPSAGGGNAFVVAFDERGVMNCTVGPPRSCTPLFRVDVGSNPGIVPPMAGAAGRIIISRIGPQTLVFDAAGQSGCSNGICTALYGLSAPWDVSVSGTTAYSASAGTLMAFDATGATGCAGTPRVCQPKWTGTLPSGLEFADPPTVSNGKVLVAQTAFRFTEAGIVAFDAAGTQGCTGSPAVCQPLWSVNWLETSGEMNHISATPTLAIVSGWTNRSFAPFTVQTLKTFDLAGNRNCTATPKLCTALSTLAAGNDQYSEIPAVAFGRVAVRDLAGIKVFAIPG